MVWVIVDKNEFAGCCGLHTLKSKQPHFGIWIKKQKRAKGIGKKVVRFVLDWGVHHLNIDFIKYPVDIKNIKSIRIIESLGLMPSHTYTMDLDKKLSILEYRYYKSKEKT